MAQAPREPINAVFGEATVDQRLQCYKLAATAFQYPLTSSSDFVEREEFLGNLPLTRDSGWRVWCLSSENDATQILATCRTLHRDLIVNDGRGTRPEQGYCISSVVTDAPYRQQGFGSLLLKKVAEWLDGPGKAAASFLYTSVDSFYASLGWHIYPSSQSILQLSDSAKLSMKNGLPLTKLLSAADLPDLCERDVERLTDTIQTLPVPSDEVVVSILPTHDLVSWLHDRAGFIASKMKEQTSHYRGSYSEESDIWMYWYHDFRRNQLVIQRISATRWNEVSTRALASLLLDARNEAVRLKAPRLIIWSPSREVQQALQHLSGELGDEYAYEEQRKSAITMIRWRGGDVSRSIVLKDDEFFARN